VSDWIEAGGTADEFWRLVETLSKATVDYVAPAAEAAQPPPPPTACLAKCIVGETGKPLPVLANALIALRSMMADTFSFDEMLRAPMLMKALKKEKDFVARPVTDVDVGIV
jgi:hypothetical protein